jgi:thromboxane-A synthase
VCDPELVHEVTVKASDKFRNRAQPPKFVTQKNGLVGARDEYWKRLRRIISPTFNVIHLKHMIPPMHEEVKVFLSKLEEACEAQQEVDIHVMFTRLTLDIIGRVAFGKKLQVQTNSDTDTLKTFSWLFRNTFRDNGVFAVLFPELWFFWQRFFPSKHRSNVLKAQEMVDTMSLELLRQRMREREAARKLESDEAIQRVPNDFLDLLLDARDKTTGEALTENEIKVQSNTFLLAGHETTANTLAYTIFLVAQDDDVDAKLYEELSAIITNEDEPLDLNQIGAMDHLQMALMEALRIYPPATRTVREANDDVVIGSKYFIPKGAEVWIPIKMINNRADLWEEPEKFLPFKRWFNEEKGKETEKRSLCWLSFGAGPRNCIGQRFALIEAKLVLAYALRRYRFKLSPGQVPLQLQPGVTTSPKYGIKVTVHRR